MVSPGRLHVRRPFLPDGVETFLLHDLQVGAAKVSLRFARQAEGASVQVIANDGGVDVAVES